MKRLLLSSVATLALASLAHAQRPARVTPPPFHFPHVQVDTLANGLRVEIVEDHSIPIVAVRAVLGIDETYDPAGKEGLALITTSALREGTTTRTPAQLADESARLGTAVAPTSFTTLPEHFEASLALMGDMLMHPAFAQASVDRRRNAQAQAYRTRAATASAAVRNLFYAVVDGRDDPITRSYYASDSSALGITRDDVVRFYDQYYGPATTTIIVAGDVTKKSALAAASRVFGGWAPRPKPAAPAVPARGQKPTAIYLYDAPGTTTYLYVGNSGPTRDARDAFAAEMMATVVADRFVQRLREDRAFMYSGNTGIVWRAVPRPSEFVGSTNVNTAKADSALIEWIAILRGIRTSAPPTPTELDNALRARTGLLWVRSDGPDSVATRLAELARDRVSPNFLEAYASGLASATANDVAAAAAKYVDVDHLAIVVTGPRKVLEPALRAANIAPVIVVDANGKPLPVP